MSQNNKGFSLIEVLVVIFVIVMISIAIINYRSFGQKTELDNTAQNILSALRLAQTKTIASEQASQYGVHFENSQYVSFAGNIYQPTDPDNKIHQVPNRLEIYEIDLLDEGSDVVFQKISGHTNQNGAIGLRMISQPSEIKTIVIHSFGQVELTSTSTECCLTNRLTDSRHTHLTLAWSIQDFNLLTLYFQDIPEVTTNINMDDYFNSDKTEFNWKGTINVNGQNQTLNVHTHSLDASNTVLSVHRDGSMNNKPVQILINDQDVISYTSDGQAVIGFWGGTMEIQ